MNAEYLKIGTVSAVKGKNITIDVYSDKNTIDFFYKGDVLRNPSVGQYVLIKKGFIDLIGKIDNEITKKTDISKKEQFYNKEETIQRQLEIGLLGYIDGGRFTKGIKEMPLSGNFAYILNKKQYTKIHKLTTSKNNSLKIGTLSQDDSMPISIDVNSIFTGHLGIFGNTGSGKSYTLAKLYSQFIKKVVLDEKQKNESKSKFILFDFNGEYGDGAIIDSKYKQDYNLSTRINNGDKFPIDIKQLYDSDFWSILLEATEKTQKPFLKRVIRKIETFLNEDNKSLNLYEDIFKKTIINNQPIEYLYEILRIFDITCTLAPLAYHRKEQKYYINDLWNNPHPNFENELSNLNLSASFKNATIKNDMDLFDKFDFLFKYYYFEDFLKGYSQKEHIEPLFGKYNTRKNNLQKVLDFSGDKEPNNNKILTVVSLSDVNTDMKKLLPLLFAKSFYTNHITENKYKNISEKNYLNIIVDEAHNILSEDSKRESETWKDYRLETFEEIIKEGRKFGAFLTLSSQRPAEITETIISQLNTFFLHRLLNDNDIRIIKKAVSYMTVTDFDMLSSLPQGECIISGIKINFPIIVKIAKIEKGKEPSSETISFNFNGEKSNETN